MPWQGFTFYGAPTTYEAGSTIASGQIFMYIGTDEPSGFLKCNGQEVNIDSFKDLYDHFTYAGVSFGSAAPGKFKLPDFRGRFPIGYDPSDTSLDSDPLIDISSIGKTGGSISHTHTPLSPNHTHAASNSHEHRLSNHTHTISHTHTIPEHTHGVGTFDLNGLSTVTDKVDFGNTQVATKRHGHTPSGHTGSWTGTSSGAQDSNNNIITTTTSTEDTYTTSQLTVEGQQSSDDFAGSTGNDLLPPYYSVNFLIKT